MVETGFTRAKNAGNVIMKNLMDFAIAPPFSGSLALDSMFGTSIGGIIGTWIFSFRATISLPWA